ncbi:MAG: hypothetical protein Kow0020_12700 [Wenzhouxiangellaceae bacterium]
MAPMQWLVLFLCCLILPLAPLSAADDGAAVQQEPWLFGPVPDFEQPESLSQRTSEVTRSGLRTFPSSPALRKAWLEQADHLRVRLRALHSRIGNPVHLRIFKASRELELWTQTPSGLALVRTYPICDVSGTLGPKRFEGDLQAPEGVYRITRENLNPNSEFHLALNIGYPNEYDRALGHTGSNIMIHGGCASRGCFAMSDYYIEQIYLLVEAALRNGQPAVVVEIYPFRMTDQALAAQAGSRWHDFWRALKPVHDQFDARAGLPQIHIAPDGYRPAMVRNRSDLLATSPSLGLISPE